jgi:hypothetical protein
MSAFRPKPDIATRSSERLLSAKSGHQLAAQQLRFVQSVMVRVRRSGPQLRSVLCRPVFCVATSLDRCVAVGIEAEQKLRRGGEAGL